MRDEFPIDPTPTPPQSEQPVETRVRFYRDPVFLTTMLAMVVVFISTYCLEFVGVALHARPLVWLARWLDNFGVADSRVFHGEVWRLITNLFMHANWGHIFGNMLVMVPMALTVRSWTKGNWWLATFLLTGMAGTLLQLVFHPGLAVVGASGGIAGLAGAALFSGWRLLKSGHGRILVLPGLVLIAAVVYLQVVGEVSGQDQNVAHLAHLGGFITGALLGRRLPLHQT